MSVASCPACHDPLSATCPSCGRRVPVERTGKLRAHEAGTVHSGHMTWGACPGSGKKDDRDWVRTLENALLNAGGSP